MCLENYKKINFLFRYVPTAFWGHSGHIQSVVHALLGGVMCSWPIGERISLPVKDGSTVLYDLYRKEKLNSDTGK